MQRLSPREGHWVVSAQGCDRSRPDPTSHDPRRAGGQPCTHSQEVILGYLVRGITEEEILAEYPTLAYEGALSYQEGKMKLIEANM